MIVSYPRQNRREPETCTVNDHPVLSEVTALELACLPTLESIKVAFHQDSDRAEHTGADSLFRASSQPEQLTFLFVIGFKITRTESLLLLCRNRRRVILRQKPESDFGLLAYVSFVRPGFSSGANE